MVQGKSNLKHISKGFEESEGPSQKDFLIF